MHNPTPLEISAVARALSTISSQLNHAAVDSSVDVRALALDGEDLLRRLRMGDVPNGAALDVADVLAAADRFWSKVGRTGDDDCWEWQASKFTSGYGQFGIGSRPWPAHRVSWVLANRRPIPRDYYVLHTCDNPGCVNPRHLFVGTHKDNMGDMIRKGRKTASSGENHHRSKLTADQVAEIRARCADPCVQWQTLASEYGVTTAAVSLLARGKSYPDAGGPIEGVDYKRHRRGFRRQQVEVEWLI